MKGHAFHWIWLTAWVGFTLLGAVPSTWAEEEPDGSQDQDRLRLSHQLDLEMESLVRVCRLDERQQRKLQMAARDLVERVVEGKEAQADQDAEQQVDWLWKDKRDESGKRELVDHPLWRHSVREVLTGDQWVALEVERRSIRRFRRQASIQVACGVLQRRFRLSDEQRNRFSDLLNGRMPGTFCEPPMNASAYLQWLVVGDVRPILTETQMACWEDMLASSEE
jgi:hypothetical protein